MKKTALLIFTIVSCTFAKAQIQFGVKAGVNLASLHFSSEFDNSEETRSTLTSFHAGVFASLPIAESFTFQPEIVYSEQGVKDKDQDANGKFMYNYLNVPLLIKYNHSTGLFAETGPQAGFLLSAKVKDGDNTVDIKSETQSFDFSWAFGIGYKIPDINLGVDLRYNLGITNTLKIPSGSSSSGSAKNSVFQFGIFYMFGAGK